MHFLVEVFILAQARVDVLKKCADTGLVAQGGILVVRLLLKDKNKPAPVPPPTLHWHLWEIFVLQHASCFQL